MGKLGAIISPNYFSLPSSLSSPGNHIYILGYLQSSHSSLVFCSFIFRLFIFVFLFWIILSAMSSSSLVFFIVVSNLLLIPSTVFYIIDVYFHIYQFNMDLYLYLPFLSLTYPYFPLHIWNVFIAVVLMAVSRNSIICVISGSVTIDYIFLNMSHIFLVLCIPGNFLLDAKHCEFYLVWY